MQTTIQNPSEFTAEDLAELEAQAQAALSQHRQERRVLSATEKRAVEKNKAKRREATRRARKSKRKNRR
jgi:hypothetical protein